jgi:hypothetical protein
MPARQAGIQDPREASRPVASLILEAALIALAALGSASGSRPLPGGARVRRATGAVGSIPRRSHGGFLLAAVVCVLALACRGETSS